jgi:two-component system, cell cycle response regulator DivK
MDTAAKLRILLVEDFEDTRDLYAQYLRFSGFDVVTADTGERGIQLAVEAQPDLILMDIGLPGISGTDAIRELKSTRAAASIPILILTAHVMNDARESAANAGADGFIPKPCLPDELVRHVCRTLDVPIPRKL